MAYYTYILTTKNNVLFYIGVTNNLERRIFEHKTKAVEHSYSSKYNIDKLVYYETFADVNYAISREKQLKNWHRNWKINLIKEKNPEMQELADELGNIVNPIF